MKRASGNTVALTIPLSKDLGAVMAFSVRPGGYLPMQDDSLSFSMGEGDCQDNMVWNKQVLAESLGIAPLSMVTCLQEHGDKVLIVDSVPRSHVRADAVIATRPGIFPGIKTADCLAILVLDPVRKVSAAVHAGWRGTVLRIIRKVIRILNREFGSAPSDLLVGLGPSIGPCCYEVDDPVLIPFRNAIPVADRFIRVVMRKDGQGSHSSMSFRLDLEGANRAELAALGVRDRNVFSTNFCTSCHPELFFSYRRDGGAAGRHLAVTGFRAPG